MQSQAIMRDINRILYQVYNSRRTHTYESTFSSPKLVNDIDRTDEDISDTLENKSEISSIFTDRTSLNSDDTNSELILIILLIKESVLLILAI